VTLLRWNSCVGDFLAEVPEARRRSALRRVSAEVAEWRTRQSCDQAEWCENASKASYCGLLAAVDEIVRRLSAA
jgi:hypothetical protein